MTDRTPSFDDLVGADLEDPERTRLSAVHDLLLAAGPPPELPPTLEVAPPSPTARVARLLARRRYTAIAAAAVVALGLFGTGYAVGRGGGPKEPVRTVVMSGAQGATASLQVFARDESGNWPMLLRVSGLAVLPQGETYALWLTRKGELAEPCGTFTAAPGTTEVPLNAPYVLKSFDGWVVVRSGATRPFLLATSST